MRTLAISVSAAMFTAGCAAFVVPAPAQTSKQTGSRTSGTGSNKSTHKAASATASTAVKAGAKATAKPSAKENSPVAKAAQASPGAAKSTSARAGGGKSTGTYKSASGKSASSKSSSGKSSSGNSASGKSSAGKNASGKSSSAKNGKSAPKPAYHPAQQQPSQDRYREIQQALADRGYFAGPVDGNWGAASMDALKRFQHDQNLTEDGKVGSLSLIALGLGPKRTAPAPAKIVGDNPKPSVQPAAGPDTSPASPSTLPPAPPSVPPAPEQDTPASDTPQ